MRRRRAITYIAVVTGLALSACGIDPAVTESSISSERPAVSVVVDSDLGPDDMMALLYLVQHPDVEVLAVTVSGTGLAHCPEGAANAMAILRRTGHEDIPVACGATEPSSGDNAFPEEWRTGTDALAAEIGLQPSSEAIDDDAIALLAEAISAADQPAHLLAIGPLTNVAALLRSDTAAVDNIAGITVMGGAFDVAGSVGPEFDAEWNIWVDPAAAAEVLASGIPIRIVPLDATYDVPATRFFYETLGEVMESLEAELLHRFFETHAYNLEGGDFFFWDPLAATSIVAPDVVNFETRSVNVDGVTGAMTETSEGLEVEVATSADRRAFEEEFLTVLNGGDAVAADIPEPVLFVRYDGDRCTFEGETEFESNGSPIRVPIELVNESEGWVSIAAGTHDGVSWEQLQRDAVSYQQTAQVPDYWVDSGSFQLLGERVTGGSTVDSLDLAPGRHALLCGTEANDLFLLTEILVLP